MLLEVTSNNPPNDVVGGWFTQLQIAPISTTGTLSFNTPVTGTPADPSNYVFGDDGLGITATNGSSTLSANDFFDPAVDSGARSRVRPA